VIVSQKDARRIAEGRKTQLRLPIARRAPDPGRVVPITFYEPVEFSHRMIPVRACYISILEKWQTRLYHVTEDEARGCGYHDRAEMLDAWDRKDQAVWAIKFELDGTHRPRLLADQVIAGRQGAYVDNPARAMRGNPGEAVDPFTQRRLSDEARQRTREHRKAMWRERAEQPFDVQLRGLVMEARSRHIDIRDELRAIERWQDPDAKWKQLDRIREKVEHPLLVSALVG
jgi:hypothetical protein